MPCNFQCASRAERAACAVVLLLWHCYAWYMRVGGCLSGYSPPRFLMSNGGVAALWVTALRVVTVRSVFASMPVPLTNVLPPLVLQREAFFLGQISWNYCTFFFLQ